jgi:hypothetical protein
MQSTASSTFEGMPISMANTLTVPTGKMPSFTGNPATPLTTSLTVPSPPAATTVS